MNSLGVKPDAVIPSSPNASAHASSRRQTLLLALILVVATVALYSRVNQFPFVNYDDGDYVTNNLHIQNGLDWDTVHWAFTTYAAANWHPVTWLSHALDCQLFDLNPGGPHDVNLLLHVINALLLFLVLQRATGFVGRSFMVAALFALHPINVESVVWISERKNLLSMLFFLLALGAYRWYASKPRASRYAVVAILFALGLMAKPQVITFPFVLLLWDYWPLQRLSFAKDATGQAGAFPPRKFSWLVKEKLPLIALSLASALITMKAQSTGGATSGFALSLRLENAIVSYAHYVLKAFWPSHLALFYPHPGASLQSWQVYGALFFLIAVTMIAVEGKRHRYLAVGWFWFLGTLVPMIGLMQVGTQGMADRYAYLSFLGLFLMVCWGVADWAPAQHLPASILPAVSVVALLALSAVTYRQVGYWRDNVTLWTHALQVTDRNWLAENNLARALMKDGRTSQAIPHFFKAAEIYPDDPISNMNIGTWEQQQGNLQVAIDHYRKVVTFARTPEIKAAALNSMGNAYRALGDDARARECFAAAASLRQ
ncbi:MAG: tetratricopeptide repeat protein [Candidatus Korobacteraceae bacterium]